MKILKHIGKTLLLLLFILLIVVASYILYAFLFSVLNYEYFPSKLLKEAAGWGLRRGFELSAIMSYALVLLYWSKKQTFGYRFLAFICLFIFTMLLYGLLCYYVGSLIAGFICLSNITVYYKLLNKPVSCLMPKQAKKKTVYFLSGGYLHHLGLSRICIIIGLLCIPLAWYIVYKDSYRAPILAYIIVLPVYFLPFIACKLYQSIIYKIYLWIKAGFSQNN